jgi:tetratricopeptide (TPR) repeat protein
MTKKVHIKTLLRTNDAFLTTSDKIYGYFVTNKKKIIIWALTIVVIFLVVMAYFIVRNNRIQNALEAFNKAVILENIDESITALSEVREKFSSTPAARQAGYALVDIYIGQKKLPEALALLNELYQTLTMAEESLRPLINNQLGALYEDVSDLENSLRCYKTALAQSELRGDAAYIAAGFRSGILNSIGRVSVEMGLIEDAKKTYNEIILLYPNSYLALTGRYKLAQLEAGLSVSEVDKSEAADSLEKGKDVEVVSEGDPSAKISSESEATSQSEDNSSEDSGSLATSNSSGSTENE